MYLIIIIKNITLLLQKNDSPQLFINLLKYRLLHVFHSVVLILVGMKWEFPPLKTPIFRYYKNTKPLKYKYKMVRPAGLEPKTKTNIYLYNLIT